MLEVAVLEDPRVASGALEPLRARLLAALTEPASAADLAGRFGISRQKLNYHLRALEQLELVREVGQVAWGGLVERKFAATANAYIVSPRALGPAAPAPERATDHLSASYLVALAARALHEVGTVVRRAQQEDKRVATLSIDTAIRFRSSAERAAFAQELTSAIHALASRYHDASAPDGRDHRLVVLAHPLPSPSEEEEQETP